MNTNMPHEEKCGRLPPLSPFLYIASRPYTPFFFLFYPLFNLFLLLSLSSFSLSPHFPLPPTALSQWRLGVRQLREAVVMVTGLLSVLCPSGIPDPESSIVFT